MRYIVYILLLTSFSLASQNKFTIKVAQLPGGSGESLWKKFHGNQIYYNFATALLTDTNNATADLVDFLVNDVDLDGNTVVAIENQTAGSNRLAGLSIISNSGNGVDVYSYGTSYSTSIFGVPLTNWSMILAGGNGLLINTSDASASVKIGANNKERIRIEGDGDIIFPNLETGVIDSFPAFTSDNKIIKMKFNPNEFTATADLLKLKYNVQFYQTAGTYTYIKPIGVKQVCVEMFAGGAGGAAGSCNTKVAGNTAQGGMGGGAGGHTWKCFTFSSTQTDTITVTVGAGGAGGNFVGTTPSTGNDGADGGTTTFGNYLRVTGGKKGKGGTPTSAFPDPGTAGDGGVGDYEGMQSSVPTITAPWTYPAQYTMSSAPGGSGCGVTYDGTNYNTLGKGQDANRIGSLITINTLPGSTGGSDSPQLAAATPGTTSLIYVFRTGGGGGSPCIGCNVATINPRHGANGYGSFGSNFAGAGGGGGAGFIPLIGSTCAAGNGGNGAPGAVLVYELY